MSNYLSVLMTKLQKNDVNADIISKFFCRIITALSFKRSFVVKNYHVL